VSTSALPPSALTRCKPVAVLAVANTIVPSGAHVAPREAPSMSSNEAGGPPDAATLRNVVLLST
jgi:hypothetical protein